MSPEVETTGKLPAPWDRIFSLGTKTFVWGLLLATLYLLRPFLLLIFLTFVFAYIQAHGVDGLQHRIKNRPLRVVIVGLVFLGTILATVFTLRPQIEEQAATLVRDYPKTIKTADEEVNGFLKKNIPQFWNWVMKNYGKTEPQKDGQPATQDPPSGQEQPAPMVAVEEPRLAKSMIDSLLGLSHPEQANHVGPDPAKSPEDLIKKVVDFGASVLGVVSSFLLSLLFSFLIVLDLPKLKRGIHGLATTKIGFIYNEVADNIAGFGLVLGRALEAQLFIAIVNTILTAVGIWMMGLPNLLVLSTIVFFCSFIPVVGTFISSTPICLLALQTDGVSMMVVAILLICIIHAVETYILNPQIYGHHMHMNPVLVLIILTISGKLFGVWGLLLGIPVMNYVFRHAIRYDQEPTDDAGKPAAAG
ncbi:MAG: AI-2E family transporter [Planctomycetes bacterium]|nr:AI-2E family transporter [Planctomycetota bacterium]